MLQSAKSDVAIVWGKFMQAAEGMDQVKLLTAKNAELKELFTIKYSNLLSELVEQAEKEGKTGNALNYIAIKLNRLNEKRIRTRFYYDAKVLGIPNVVDLRELLKKYLEVFIKKFNKASFKIDGWNALLKFINRPPVVRENKETRESSSTTSYYLTPEQIESIIKSRKEKINNQEKNTNKGA